jgi:hypothetical protein
LHFFPQVFVLICSKQTLCGNLVITSLFINKLSLFKLKTQKAPRSVEQGAFGDELLRKQLRYNGLQ